MSSFFQPTTTQGAKTPAQKNRLQNTRGKKAISLSLLLGMTPALTVTPAMHADAAQAKPAQVEPAQADPASPASPAASLQATPVAAAPAASGTGAAATGVSDADKIDLKVTTGTLNISQGGTVSVTTSPLTPEFRKKYKLFQFGLVNRGTGYEWSRTGEATQYPLYRGKVDHLRDDGIVRDNPDGSLTFTFEVKKQTIPAAPSPALDVVLTYYPAGEREPNAEEYEDPRLTARTPLSLTQDPEPDHTTYVYSMPAVDNPWVDTQLKIEGYHILSKQLVEPGSAPAYLMLYEVDPATGKMVGKPVFTHKVRYTDCGEYYCWSFLNNYFSADVTIPAGTLRPGKSYMIGVYSGLFPNPDEEKVPGSLLTDIAPFIPVRSPNSNTEVKDAAPVLRVEPQQMDQYRSDSPQVSPYWKKNTLQVRAVNLPNLAEGHYRFSLQATDASGNLTGQKALEQDIAADRIQSGYTEATLTVPGEALNYQGGYKLVVEKVLPGQGGAADSVQQVVSTDLGLVVNAFEEREAAKRWYKAQQLPKSESYSSENLTRRDLTVVLYRLAGSPKVELPATSPYPDVQPNDPDYAAIVWARQKGITFGWADGKFHPEAALSTRSAVAFLYRYQRMVAPAPAPESSSVPSSSVPKNSSVPGDSPVRVSRSHWSDYERTDTAFWRESLWATQQFIWGYTDYDRRYAEGFSSDTVSSSEFSVMLYRMAHGGSRLT
ncbi:S-layer homology domain-containing protein [Rothia mucilaginosa]